MREGDEGRESTEESRENGMGRIEGGNGRGLEGVGGM
jgi:hypothetical protein